MEDAEAVEEVKDMPMQKLFADNIRSPGPATALEANTEEFPFYSQLTQSTSASTQGSPGKSGWLTQQSQAQSSAETGLSYTHGEPPPPTRRKGNPRLLFMGMRRCGKSSVQKVVFQKLPPADTLYLEPTTKIEQAEMQSFIPITSAELPFHLPILSPNYDHAPIFTPIGAVIWLIDSQDDYLPSITELLRLAVFLAENYPACNLEVFIHKTDGLSEEYKYDTFREVRQRVQDELADYGHGDRSVSYYQTSVFDYSVFEAMSKVIQKLLPQLGAMERLLTRLCSVGRMQKAYLFDTVSKVYIATDASPTFLRDYEVCSDYVDVVVDLKQIYGWRGDEEGEVGGVNESIVSYDKTGDTYVYAREMNNGLSLMCLMGKDSVKEEKILNDYNIDIVCNALGRLFSV